MKTTCVLVLVAVCGSLAVGQVDPSAAGSSACSPGRVHYTPYPGSGMSTKILWAFLASAARDGSSDDLVVRGHRLDGPGSFAQRFAAIGYEGQDGAPSYASIVGVPRAGCWRLDLSTAKLRGWLVVRAVAR